MKKVIVAILDAGSNEAYEHFVFDFHWVQDRAFFQSEDAKRLLVKILWSSTSPNYLNMSRYKGTIDRTMFELLMRGFLLKLSTIDAVLTVLPDGELQADQRSSTANAAS